MRRVKRVIVLILIVMLCMPLLTGVQTEAADGEKHLDFMIWDQLSLQIAFLLAYMLRNGLATPIAI